MKVVLVHGFLNRGSIMRSLASSLEEGGHETFLPSLSPCDGRSGIAKLARDLKSGVEDRFGADSPIVLVGFSMGAIISRCYLQDFGGRSRVVLFASIAGPHFGTWSASLYPGHAAREMRVGSAFLAKLNARMAEIEMIPTVCYWSPFDIMIRPHSSTKLGHADAVRIPALIHSLLLFDRRLHVDLLKRIDAVRNRG